MPKYAVLSQLSSKRYFTIADAAAAFAIKPASARVLCVRYVKQGIFVRVKNNFYLTDQRWERLTDKDCLELANYIQVPSYISFLSALSFYGITTQIPRQFFESVSLKRSKTYSVRGASFTYYKLSGNLYRGYVKKDGVFLATPEKAFLDAVYLCSFGKYKLDTAALDTGKLDTAQLARLARWYPKKTQKLARKICGT